VNAPVLGFIPETSLVPLDALLPSKKIPVGLFSTVKFKQIVSSIEEIGLIEPLSISRMQADGHYLVLDGHVRLLALRELGYLEALCLVAIDDESYTYNTKINRLATVGEHRMLRKAVQRGVPAERLARALNVDVSQILKKVRLLDGICPEVVDLLRERQFSAEISRLLRKMKPTRQVECVDLMLLANNLTIPYAEALLAATPAEQLYDAQKAKKLAGVSAEQMLRMEREMANLQGQYELIERSYADDVLNLVLARGYIAKLLENEAVARFIRQRHPQLREQLDHIIAATSLEQ
jgi:hypothetical protein